ncbi:uncharacterized protein LOC143345652 [Colletes latitarsis]|uniref:uncharacterized protein LOC143345652 n=1 Tax=Colletes latitarsis TaxID=2605962 RepID=UPI004036E0D3
MSGKIEYLEKYSVAPSPSRDYYGLKVLRDQVILYLWKISHGPHKTPIVRTTSFEDFEPDKSLQDEIRRIFGKHLLRHIRNIAAGRRSTLLTLPRNLIERLARYLTVNDIVKLTSLSHVSKEVFSQNSVWETLYKKYKPLTKRKYEKLYVTTRDWKQLFQQIQIERVMNEQRASVWAVTSSFDVNSCPSSHSFKYGNKKKSLEAKSGESGEYGGCCNNSNFNSMILICSISRRCIILTLLFLSRFKVPHARMPAKQIKTNSKSEDVPKHYNANSRGTTKIVPSVTKASKKLSEDTRKKVTQNPITKKLSDIRLDKSKIENEKIVSEKKVPILRSLQESEKKSTKATKDQSMIVKKNESRREVESKYSFVGKIAETKSSKGQNSRNKILRADGKINNTSVRTMEEKPSSAKPRSSTLSKALRSEQSTPSLTLADQSKLKTRGKTKKIGQSKSTILNTNTALVAQYSSIGGNSPDLADFIEACMKNNRCSRSIFDYDGPSCIDKLKSCAGDGKAQEDRPKIAESLSALKSDRVRASLDRLSEKSEPSTAKSLESLNRSDVSGPSVTLKNKKVPKQKTRKSATSNKNECKFVIPEDKEDIFERYGIYSKCSSPRMNCNVEEKCKRTPDKMGTRRSSEVISHYSRTVTNSKNDDVHRYQLRKTMNTVHKY